jgi:hypothetical protein
MFESARARLEASKIGGFFNPVTESSRGTAGGSTEITAPDDELILPCEEQYGPTEQSARPYDAPAETPKESTEVVWHTAGEGAFVRDAPTIQELLTDTSRDSTVTCWQHDHSLRELEGGDPNPAGYEQVTYTVHEALNGLDTFLQETHAELATYDDPELQGLAQWAEYIRENLRFADKKEFDEATAAFAGLWKERLAAGSKNRLCVPQGIIRTGEASAYKKSDSWMFEGVTAHLSPDERAHVLTNVEDIKDPRHTDIILLDDGYKSGSQIINALDEIHQRIPFRARSLQDGISLNLLAASDRQIREPNIEGLYRPPTHAYLNAGADMSRSDRMTWGPLATNWRSSVDIHFEDKIGLMTIARNQLNPDRKIMMPPLTNIVRRT